MTARDALAPPPVPGEPPRSIWRDRWLLLVVDDGASPRLRPWRVGRSRLCDLQVGDRVVLRGHRYARYVTAVRRID